MAPQAKTPPPLIPAPSRFKTPAIVVAVVLALIVVARVTEGVPIPFYRCSFKMLTGLPCAFCGGTRSLRALSHFHVAEAFWLNPLVLLAAFASVGWLIFWMILPRRVTEGWKAAVLSRPLLKLGVLLSILNWIFVMLFLPR